MEKELNVVYKEDGSASLVYSEGGQEVATLNWDKTPDKVQSLLTLVIDLVKKEQDKASSTDSTEKDVKMF